MNTINSENIQENLKTILQRIHRSAVASKRAAEEVRLMGVCKYQPLERIRAALTGGLKDFGNNYVQNLSGQIQELNQELKNSQWHFIGRLQRNKVKPLLKMFVSRNLSLPWIHTLEHMALAQEIQKNLENLITDENQRKIQCLIQVLSPNHSGKEGNDLRSGCRQEEVLAFLKAVRECPSLWVQGLMIIPPLYETIDESRADFQFLRTLRDDLQKEIKGLGCERIDLKELSMGMSDDLEIAISEGSTLIRVGTGIFGPRKN